MEKLTDFYSFWDMCEFTDALKEKGIKYKIHDDLENINVLVSKEDLQRAIDVIDELYGG